MKKFVGKWKENGLKNKLFKKLDKREVYQVVIVPAFRSDI